jgi:hypothetical protein
MKLDNFHDFSLTRFTAAQRKPLRIGNGCQGESEDVKPFDAPMASLHVCHWRNDDLMELNKTGDLHGC